MAKRFTDTEKWRDPWFCGLTIEEKCFWSFILDNSNLAGIWQVNWPLVKFYLPSFKFKEESFKDRVYKLTPEKWFIPKFVKFQYGELQSSNRLHQRIIFELSKEGVSIPLQYPFEGVKDKEEDKDKVKDKDMDREKDITTLSVQSDFVKRFAETYEAKTGEPYKADKKDYIISAQLIKAHGLESCIKKAIVLAVLCESKSAWFTKDGWASYTIGKLSSQWNSIIPESKQLTKEEELAEEIKKQREMNERVDDLLKRR